jgi:hypothetical protein
MFERFEVNGIFFCCQNIKNVAVSQLDIESPKERKKVSNDVIRMCGYRCLAGEYKDLATTTSFDLAKGS